MSKTITAFDAKFPYRLTDEEAYELEKLRGLLAVLTDLSGTASLLDKHRSPEVSNERLHETFWMMHDSLDTVITHYNERSRV